MRPKTSPKRPPKCSKIDQISTPEFDAVILGYLKAIKISSWDLEAPQNDPRTSPNGARMGKTNKK